MTADGCPTPPLLAASLCVVLGDISTERLVSARAPTLPSSPGASTSHPAKLASCEFAIDSVMTRAHLGLAWFCWASSQVLPQGVVHCGFVGKRISHVVRQPHHP